jgi:hypothetical protein
MSFIDAFGVTSLFFKAIDVIHQLCPAEAQVKFQFQYSQHRIREQLTPSLGQVYL